MTTPTTTECLGIDAEFLHADGMELFHLGALRRLMRCIFLSPSVCFLEVGSG